MDNDESNTKCMSKNTKNKACMLTRVGTCLMSSCSSANAACSWMRSCSAASSCCRCTSAPPPAMRNARCFRNGGDRKDNGGERNALLDRRRRRRRRRTVRTEPGKPGRADHSLRCAQPKR